MAPYARFGFSDRDSLLDAVRGLNLDIPFSSGLDVLFQKVRVGEHLLSNRLAVLPLEGADAAPDGSPGELTFRRYHRFARSGCGLIWFEATSVCGEGRSNPNQLWLNGRNVDAFRSLVDETRRAAAPAGSGQASPLLILQLTHSGRFSRPGPKRAPVIVRHHPELDRALAIPGDQPLLSDEALDRLAEDYFSAARLAASAGFDGVDIKACHGYLVSELLAAFSRPLSRYGGSFENRTRFLLDVVGRVKDAAPGTIVTTRLGVFDGVSNSFGFGVDRRDGRREDLTEPKALVGRLQTLGVPLLGLSLGIPFLKPYLSRPLDAVPSRTPVPEEHPLESIDRLLRLTAEIQKEFPELPMVGAGYSWLRQFWPEVAAGVLSQGRAGIVGLGRALLAYPEALQDLSAEGNLKTRRVCTACSRCADMLRGGVRVGCSVRDKEVYAAEYRALSRALRSKERP